MVKKVGYVAPDAKLAQIAVRLDPKVLTKVSRLAGKNKVSVSAQMRSILTAAVSA